MGSLEDFGVDARGRQTNATGFVLESATNLASSTVWNTNSTAPIIISGQNVVTDSISDAQKFYRLSQSSP